ncbi:MAG TPA: conjugal transfer protein [Solirubrobacteraceae bacterium]|nr:conjugal transfer protein [Solirubrobacteraceae bacterium]
MSVEQDTIAERERGGRASVAITTRPMWRLQLASRIPRYLLYATCLAGLLASVRFAVDPPRARQQMIAAPISPTTDSAAEGYATLFARRYLTWEATQPQLSEQSLAPMIGAALAQGAGIVLPPSGAQHVLWAEVVQARAERSGAHVYTVAAQTDTAGLLYLTVGVEREADGSLAIAGYPAFVGAPQSGPAQSPAQAPEVSDRALAAVVERGLRNYLAAAPEELAADLSSHAPVAVPQLALTLESVQRLSWSSDPHSVLAVVQAHDARGVRYTLGYELDVADVEGRWEISAIQMDSRG